MPPAIPEFESYRINESDLSGLGHPSKSIKIKLPGEKEVDANALIFIDDYSIMLLIRPTKMEDLELFYDKSFSSKLEKYVTSNLSKGVKMIKEHERSGILFEFTEQYFQITLDNLF